MNKVGVRVNRKEAIYDAAVQCFIENGYYTTSMDMIADEAGMTKRGLYYHFKSKDQLFIELFHYMNRKYYDRIPEFGSDKRLPEDRLRLYVEIAGAVLQENTDFLRFSQEFMSIGVRKSEIRAVMTASYLDQVQRVKSIIEEGIAAGQFRQVDTQKMARSIVLITIGVFTVYFSLDDAFDYIEQHAFNIEQIITAMKKTQSGKLCK
jgi:AcrR family transcriptional regulator